MKPFARIAILIIAASTAGATPPSAHRGSTQIAPGRTLGRVHVGALDTTVQKALGKPFVDEEAPGAGYQAWKLKGGEMSVRYHRIYKGEKYLGVPVRASSIHVVRQVRTTSPDFFTAGGIHVGSNLAEISGRFPGVRPLGTFSPQKSRLACSLHDDTAQGIAFEIESESGRCRAVVVHAPGEEPRQMDDEREDWQPVTAPKLP